MKYNFEKITVFLIITILFFPILLKSQQPKMILVEGGKFKMGNRYDDNERKGDKDEYPAHKVTVSSFYICEHEVTVKEYKQYCKETGKKMPAAPNSEWLETHPETAKHYPSMTRRWWGWGSDLPMHNIFWVDAVKYCNWLSEKNGLEKCYTFDSNNEEWTFDLNKNGYRLPTEAEWEYAARGGDKSKGYRFSGSNNPDEVAWYDKTSALKGPQKIKTKKPNELGIYDMSGNVWEWCNDYYWIKFYEKSNNAKDPVCTQTQSYRVVRGGAWHYRVQLATVTSRDGPEPAFANYNYGFRVAKTAK